jgi:hypothetical protein
MDLQIQSQTEPEKSFMDSLNMENRQRLSRKIDAGVSSSIEKNKGSNMTAAESSRNLGAGFSYGVVSFDSTSGIISMYDTSEINAGIEGAHFYSYTRFFGPLERPESFVNCAVTANWQAQYLRQENHLSGFPDAVLPLRYHKNALRERLETKTIFSAALGRRSNVTPVYQAMMIEKEMKKCGAIRFDLSDSTIIKISRLAAERGGCILHKHEEIRRFKGTLDSIVSVDVAADKERLKYLSLFGIKRLMLMRMPAFFGGTRAGLKAEGVLTTEFTQFKNEFWDNFGMDHTDTSGYTAGLEGDAVVSFFGGWGIPAAKRIFLDITVSKPAVSAQKGLDFYYDREFDSDRLFRVYWGLESTFLISSALLASIGCEQAPASIILPVDWPGHSWVNVDMMLEDNFSIRVSLTAYHREVSDILISGTISGHEINGFGLGLFMSYGF